MGLSGFFRLALAVSLCAAGCDYPWPQERTLGCGDGVIDTSEVCDGSDMGGKTCAALGFDGGDLLCGADCRSFDKSGCHRCGDGKKNGAEACDGAAVGGATCAGLGFEGGTLKCKGDCKALVTSACYKCGDQLINNKGEVCDGTNLSGKTCKGLGWVGGTLKCRNDCAAFDFSSCYKCGDGKTNGADICDGADLGGATCVSKGLAGGTLGCKKDCSGLDFSGCYKCGDKLKSGTEVCDGADLGGTTCKGLGYDGGTLKCRSDCKGFDVSVCHKCGDGLVGGNEVCDGANLAGKTCKTQGLGGGTLKCKAGCKALDKSSCYKCGDGKKNGPELCDGNALDGKTCKDFSWDGGTLKCKAGCAAFDQSSCHRCGDNKRAGPETCDGTDLAGGDCKTVKLQAGTLNCTKTCTYDSSKCKPYGFKWAVRTGEWGTNFNGGLAADGVNAVHVTGPTGYLLNSFDYSGKLAWRVKATKTSGNDIALDSAGNSYVLGTHMAGATVDGGPPISSSNGGYLAKVDSTGKVLWTRTFDLWRNTSLAPDTTGNFYIGGHDFNKQSKVVIKLDSTGKELWSISSKANVRDIALDSSGSLYITGDFKGTVSLGGKTLTNSSTYYSHLFVAKVDSTGKVLWAVAGSGQYSSKGSAITVDSKGALYVAGDYATKITVGGKSLSNSGNMDLLVFKMDSAGQTLWMASATGQAASYSSDIKVDSGGNTYVTGIVHGLGSETIAGVAYTPVGGLDGVVARLDASGKFLWSALISSGGGDSTNALALDSQQRFFVSGFFLKDLTLTPPKLTVMAPTTGMKFNQYVLQMECIP